MEIPNGWPREWGTVEKPEALHEDPGTTACISSLPPSEATSEEATPSGRSGSLDVLSTVKQAPSFERALETGSKTSSESI